MIWHVAAVLVLVLVGLPLIVLPSWAIGVLAVISGALCAGGIAALSVPVLTAGATLAMIEYALALSMADTPPHFLMAMGFGVALFLLLEVVDFMGRVRGVAIGVPVMTSMVRYWLAVAGVGAGLIVGLAAGAAAVRLAAPLPSYPAAAVGAFGAFVAAVGVVRLIMKSPARPSRGDAEVAVRGEE